MAEITIHFRGICTHLVNGTRHNKAPQNIFLQPIHDGRMPQYRVVLPSWTALPDKLKQTPGPDLIPEHFPRFRYHDGEVTPPAEWPRRMVGDGLWEHDLTGGAIWFSNVQEDIRTTPPAQALAALPPIWVQSEKAGVSPPPALDLPAVNRVTSHKIAAYVDFFGGQTLVIVDTEKFPNQVKATLRLRDGDEPPQLICSMNNGALYKATIRPGATIEISNAAKEPAPCCTRDYRLHYLATMLNLKEVLPEWTIREGPDTLYCSSGTYP